MLKVGLTGGLACGKSFVGRALAELGCHLIQADEIGHAVLMPRGEAYEGVIREFGPEVLAPDGTIDRKRLAAQVFNNPERLAVLNHLVHPPVIRRQEEMIEQYSKLDPNGIAVVEAAILIETGSYKRFDKLVLVVCEEQQQIRRAIQRDSANQNEIVARLGRQMPLAEKRKYADYVIDTSGAKQETLRQVHKVYESLRSLTV